MRTWRAWVRRPFGTFGWHAWKVIARCVRICTLMVLTTTSCGTPREASEAVSMSESLSSSPASTGQVQLALRAVERSGRCSIAITMNPGSVANTVVCHLAAFDPAGRLIYAGLIPGPVPGHRRSSGFEARPGRDPHGVFDLPIDSARDTFEATCKTAAWHGAPPI